MKSNLISPVPAGSPTLRFVVASVPTLGASGGRGTPTGPFVTMHHYAWPGGKGVFKPGAVRGADWPPSGF